GRTTAHQQKGPPSLGERARRAGRTEDSQKATRTPSLIMRSTYAALVSAVPPAMPVICPNVRDVKLPCGLANTPLLKMLPASIRASNRRCPPIGNVRNTDRSTVLP